MIRRPIAGPLLAVTALIVQSAAASDLSYTFIDFQAISNSTDFTGSQSPVPAQTVDVVTEDGDGIAIAGSVAIGERFFFDGGFLTSIVDVRGVISNPFVSTEVTDNFDLIQSRFGLGYQREIRPNLDLVFAISYDSMEFDFGSFAGENFDMQDSGAGARIGFRYNPRPELELYGHAHFSAVGEADLTLGEFDSDTRLRLGVLWYFFEDLGIGFDYEAGEVNTFSISMRFSFGDLRVQ
jgi:hypothetical protein